VDELGELYQQVILDHNRRPRHYGTVAGATGRADGYNPVCGDRITVHVRVEGDTIVEASFEGSGCAISRASASLMTEAVGTRSLSDADRIFREFQSMVTADPSAPAPSHQHPVLGKLVSLAGVRAFPSRIKCATLAWHALRAALGPSNATVSTE
jgi:nitrogen fixation NifU-like protein